jgi:hypothetical protein
MTTEQQIKSAIDSLNEAMQALKDLGLMTEEEVICTFCNDNSKSCSACDDGYKGE